MENLYNLSRLCTVRPPVKISASDIRGETRPAPLVELVDTIDLGSIAVRFESSSLSWGTSQVAKLVDARTVAEDSINRCL